MGSHKATAFANAIGFSRPPERLLGLLRQHERLLADVTRKRKALDRAREEIAQVAAEVARRLEPIIEESRRIDAELHGLFAELLARSKLSKRARHSVRKVYEELQEEGVLSPRPHDREASASAGFDEEEHAPDENGDESSDDEGHRGGSARARRGGDAAGDRV